MSFTFSSVSCCEEYATQEESWQQDEVSCSVVLRCAWASRYLLVADLLTGSTGGGPRAWPYHVGYSAAPRCAGCSIKPADTHYLQATQGIAYVDALVTAQYSTDVSEDLISESLEPTAEFLTLDYKRFRWSGEEGGGSGTQGDPLLEAEAPGRIVRGLALVRKHFNVENIPASVLTLPGSVNNASYTSSLLGLTFAAETLLFEPPTLDRTITTDGAGAWNMGLKFIYQPSGWNKFWRAKTQQYESICLMDGTEYNNYPPKDFSDFLV